MGANIPASSVATVSGNARTSSHWLAAALAACGVPFHPLFPAGVVRDGKGHESWRFADSGSCGASTMALMHCWENPSVASEKLDAETARLANHPDPAVRETAAAIDKLRLYENVGFARATLANRKALNTVEGKEMVTLNNVGRFSSVTIETQPSEATKRRFGILT